MSVCMCVRGRVCVCVCVHVCVCVGVYKCVAWFWVVKQNVAGCHGMVPSFYGLGTNTHSRGKQARVEKKWVGEKRKENNVKMHTVIYSKVQ